MRLPQFPDKHNAISVLVAATFAAPAALLAQNASTTTQADSTFTLGTVEVIGQREVGPSAQVLDVVDAQTLAAKHRDDLSEALDLIPGVSLQNLGQRRERLITVRGFASRQVPLFIDGIPVYVPYDGNVDLARFGVDYVSEITVSKGLTSLLYGPNILGGAVNVVPQADAAVPGERTRRVGDGRSLRQQRETRKCFGRRQERPLVCVCFGLVREFRGLSSA